MLQDALSITGFHLLLSTRNAKAEAIEPGKLLLSKRTVVSTVDLQKAPGWDAKPPEDTVSAGKEAGCAKSLWP